MNGEEMYDSCLTENMTLGTQTGDTGRDRRRVPCAQ